MQLVFPVSISLFPKLPLMFLFLSSMEREDITCPCVAMNLSSRVQLDISQLSTVEHKKIKFVSKTFCLLHKLTSLQITVGHRTNVW